MHCGWMPESSKSPMTQICYFKSFKGQFTIGQSFHNMITQNMIKQPKGCIHLRPGLVGIWNLWLWCLCWPLTSLCKICYLTGAFGTGKYFRFHPWNPPPLTMSLWRMDECINSTLYIASHYTQLQQYIINTNENIKQILPETSQVTSTCFCHPRLYKSYWTNKNKTKLIDWFTI